MTDFETRLSTVEATCEFIREDMTELKTLIKENHHSVIAKLDQYNGCIHKAELSIQHHDDEIKFIRSKGAIQLAIITGICTTVCGGLLLAIATRLF